MTSQQSWKTHFHAASRNHGDQDIHVRWQRRMRVLAMHELPCDKQVSACLRGINSTVHQLATTSHVISWIPGLYPCWAAGTWPSVHAGLGSRTPPVPLTEPRLIPSHLLYVSPPKAHPHLRLRWRHIDRKWPTANQVRVSAQRDVTRNLQRCRPGSMTLTIILNLNFASYSLFISLATVLLLTAPHQ